MHRILCYIKSLDSKGSVTICGTDGCYVEYRDSCGTLNRCNIFWLYGADKIRSVNATLQVDAASNLFQMLLQAKANQLKLELGVVFSSESIIIQAVKLI